MRATLLRTQKGIRQILIQLWFLLTVKNGDTFYLIKLPHIINLFFLRGYRTFIIKNKLLPNFLA